MTRSAGGSRGFMTQRMTRAAAALLVGALLGGSLVACGRYGKPQPYPPGVERPDHHDDDEDQEQLP